VNLIAETKPVLADFDSRDKQVLTEFDSRDKHEEGLKVKLIGG